MSTLTWWTGEYNEDLQKLLNSEEQKLWQQIHDKLMMAPLVKNNNITSDVCKIISDFASGNLIECWSCNEMNSFLAFNETLSIQCVNSICNESLKTKWCPTHCNYYTVSWYEDECTNPCVCNECLNKGVCNDCQVYCGAHCKVNDVPQTGHVERGCGDWICMKCFGKGINDCKFEICGGCSIWSCNHCQKNMKGDGSCDECSIWLCNDCFKIEYGNIGFTLCNDCVKIFQIKYGDTESR